MKSKEKRVQWFWSERTDTYFNNFVDWKKEQTRWTRSLQTWVKVSLINQNSCDATYLAVLIIPLEIHGSESCSGPAPKPNGLFLVRQPNRGVARTFEWGSSAEGARSEAPKVPRGVGCGPPGEGSREGDVPPPQKKFDYLTLKWWFWCASEVFWRTRFKVLHDTV